MLFLHLKVKLTSKQISSAIDSINITLETLLVCLTVWLYVILPDFVLVGLMDFDQQIMLSFDLEILLI